MRGGSETLAEAAVACAFLDSLGAMVGPVLIAPADYTVYVWIANPTPWLEYLDSEPSVYGSGPWSPGAPVRLWGRIRLSVNYSGDVKSQSPAVTVPQLAADYLRRYRAEREEFFADLLGRPAPEAPR